MWTKVTLQSKGLCFTQILFDSFSLCKHIQVKKHPQYFWKTEFAIVFVEVVFWGVQFCNLFSNLWGKKGL